MAGDFQQTLRPRLQQDNHKVTVAVAASMGQVALFIGLTHLSPYESHRYIAHELVSAYGLLVDHHTEEQWQDRAAVYAHVFCRRSERPVSLNDQQKMKSAFHDGINFGATKQFRWAKLAPDSPQKLQKTAQRIGLTDRARFATNECDAAKLHLVMEHAKQRRLLEGRPSSRLLADADDEDARSVFEMDEDGVVV